MWVSEREAAGLLAGVVPTREHARLLLRAGFAGTSSPTAAATLYDTESVRSLADWPLVDEEELSAVCPLGVYVARLSRATPVDLRQPWSRRAAVLARQPRMPELTRALVSARLRHAGALPWVATLCGFVALCADATSVRTDPPGPEIGRRTAFTLAEPGAWAVALEGHRFPTGRGRPWVVWLPPRDTLRA